MSGHPEGDGAKSPVEIIADSLASADFVNSLASYDDDAWYLLNSLTQAGWRIVRTESVEASTEDGPDWFARIAEEWTP